MTKKILSPFETYLKIINDISIHIQFTPIKSSSNKNPEISIIKIKPIHQNKSRYHQYNNPLHKKYKHSILFTYINKSNDTFETLGWLDSKINILIFPGIEIEKNYLLSLIRYCELIVVLCFV